MKRIVIILIMGLTINALSQTFQLRDANDKTFGPFTYKDGAVITLGTNVFILELEKQLAIESRTLNKVLSETIIPEVNFRDARVKDILDYLMSLSQGHIEVDGERIRLNLVVNVKSQQKLSGSITFSAKEITLGDLIKTVLSVTGLRARVDKQTLIIYD
ncbi:MAG: hypothetical protein GX811_00970 [Lentisphaerae bacterium]|nr:hypothetical protein [Lentisphaerota bacterium]